jgi:hypothetical protein
MKNSLSHEEVAQITKNSLSYEQVEIEVDYPKETLESETDHQRLAFLTKDKEKLYPQRLNEAVQGNVETTLL